MPDFQTTTRCFACGPDNPLGLKLRFECSGGTARASFTIREEFAGYMSYVHGGILATVLDEAMAYAAISAAGKAAVTADINIRYLKSLQTGTPATVTGRVTRTARKLIEAEAEITEDAGGGVIARATAKLVVMQD